VYVVEQEIQRQGEEDEEGRIEQVGDNADAEQPGVRGHVPGRGCRVAGDVHLGFHETLGEAAEDADEQIEDAGGSGQAFG